MRRAFILAFLLVACGETVPQAPAPLGGPCEATEDCAQPFVCQDGCCGLEVTRFCSLGTSRCNGSDVETCCAGDDCNSAPGEPELVCGREVSPGGDHWVHRMSCPVGCSNGACIEQLCSPGTLRCSGNVVEGCIGNRWQFMESCADGCLAGACSDP